MLYTSQSRILTVSLMGEFWKVLKVLLMNCIYSIPCANWINPSAWVFVYKHSDKSNTTLFSRFHNLSNVHDLSFLFKFTKIEKKYFFFTFHLKEKKKLKMLNVFLSQLLNYILRMINIFWVTTLFYFASKFSLSLYTSSFNRWKFLHFACMH